MADESNNEVKEKSVFDIKIIFIGFLLFVIAMGSSYFLMKSLIAPLMPQEEKENGNHAPKGILVPIGGFTTNIDSVEGARFLRVEVTVEVSSKEAQEKLSQFMPVVQDSILTILASKTVADLDVRNRGGLKEEIKRDLNAKLGDNVVVNVYFTDFIMQ